MIKAAKQKGVNGFNVLEFCETTNNKQKNVIKAVLLGLLAEYKEVNSLADFYEATKVSKVSFTNTFLSETTIYRTDADGMLNDAIVSELPLNKVGFRLNAKHTLVTCSTNNLKAALFNHATVVLHHCSIFARIEKTHSGLLSFIADVEQAEAAAKAEAEAKKEAAAKTEEAKAAEAAEAAAAKEAEDKKLEAIAEHNKKVKEAAKAKKEAAKAKKEAETKQEAA